MIHPKSAYPIYISKGSNPFNFHEIGCLLGGDLDTRNTRIGPIGFSLGGHHTWEITMQIIGALTSSHQLLFSFFLTFPTFPINSFSDKYLNTMIHDNNNKDFLINCSPICTCFFVFFLQISSVADLQF